MSTAAHVVLTAFATLIGVVYHKAIQLRDLSGYTVGELVNLSSNDGQRMFGTMMAVRTGR